MTYKQFQSRRNGAWQLGQWSIYYSDDTQSILTDEEVEYMKRWLREHHYPKPQDCREEKCVDVRPACRLGVCKFAVEMCGDF